MPLFSHTTALLNNRANSASTVSNGGNTTGSFDAAMESIGTALGELRSGIEGLPNNIEQAFIKAISSDTANESIYDAVASASYDAYSAVQSDHGMASGLLPTTGAKGVSGDDKLPGRSFSLKELFATSEPATAAGDRKRMQDLQQNFYANLAPEFYTKGAKVFDKILAGDLDVASIADNLSAMNVGDDGGDDTDWLDDILNTVSNLLPSRRRKKGKRGKKDKGKNNKPNKKPSGDKGRKGDSKKTTKDNKEKTQSGKKGTEESKDNKNKKNSSNKNKSPSKNNPPKKTPTGPKQASNAGQKVATEGTKTAAKTGAKTAAKTGGKVAAKTGAKVATKVAAKVAAKTVLRAVPVVGQVAGAAMLAYDAYQIGSGLKELHDVVGQSKETVKQMNEANLGNFKERQKDKPGGEARIAAFEESQKASAKLHDVQNSAGVLAFANDEKANSALQEYRDIMSGKVKMEGAKEGEPLDREAVKEYALSRIKGIGSGWTKDLAEALIDNAIADDKFNEVLANTSPNGQDNNGNKDNKDNATGDKKPAENTQSGQPGAPGTNDAPMAAGSMENNARETVNAGTGVMTRDIMTVEAQMQQYKQFTFEGIRDALLLPEVQNMFTTTAQAAGAAVEQKLMG